MAKLFNGFKSKEQLEKVTQLFRYCDSVAIVQWNVEFVDDRYVVYNMFIDTGVYADKCVPLVSVYLYENRGLFVNVVNKEMDNTCLTTPIMDAIFSIKNKQMNGEFDFIWEEE